MRRTARALSLAAATGAALAALAPAASAGTVPDDGASWGTASPSPCPRPEGHAWEPDAALEPAGPEAAVPKSTALDELEAEPEAELGADAEFGTGAGSDAEFGTDAGSDAEFGAGLDAGPGTDADTGAGSGAELGTGTDAGPDADAGPGTGTEIPAPQESDPADPEPADPKALKSRPTASRVPASKTPEPKPTESKGTPCPTAPAHQGVHAGAGGAFTDSVPALAAGGLLIAGAFGAAAHRVYRDRTTRADG